MIHMCVIQIIGPGLLIGIVTPSQKMAGSIAYVCIYHNMYINSVKLACFKKVSLHLLSMVIGICLVDICTPTHAYVCTPHTSTPIHIYTHKHVRTHKHIHTQTHIYTYACTLVHK